MHIIKTSKIRGYYQLGIKLNYIYEQLQKYSPSLYPANNDNRLLIDEEMLSVDIDEFHSNVLYIAKASILPKIEHKIDKELVFLVKKDEDYNLNSLLEKGVTILEIPPAADDFSFEEVRNLFLKDSLYLNSSADLLDALISDKGLNHIINTSSELLQNPVILIDSGFRILAHSDAGEINEPFWLNNIKKGYCSYEFISEVKSIEAVKQSPDSSEPYEVVCSASPIKKLVSKVRIDGKSIGYIILIESKQKFIDGTYQTMKLLSHVISEKLKKNKRYRNLNGLMHENILIDILEKNITSKEVLLERSKSADYSFGENLFLLTIDISNYHANKTKTSSLKESLRYFFPNEKFVFYQGNILILIDLANDVLAENIITTEFEKFITQNNLKVVISDNFSHILDLPHYYKQVLNILELAEMLGLTKKVLYYKDYKFYYILYKKDFSKLELLDLCNKGLLQIIQYDKKHNTEYYKTLKRYIEEDRNAIRTSEKMYVHRNTINYRLNKVKELGDLNLKNSDEVFDLTMTFKLLNFIDNQDQDIQLI